MSDSSRPLKRSSVGLGGIVPMGIMSRGDSALPRIIMSPTLAVRPARYEAMPGVFEPAAACA